MHRTLGYIYLFWMDYMYMYVCAFHVSSQRCLLQTLSPKIWASTYVVHSLSKQVTPTSEVSKLLCVGRVTADSNCTWQGEINMICSFWLTWLTLWLLSLQQVCPVSNRSGEVVERCFLSLLFHVKALKLKATDSG